MLQLLDSLRHFKTPQTVEREIAPGVRVQIRKPPRSFSLSKRQPLAGLGHRMHDAWDVLWGKAHAMNNQALAMRLRRAA